MSREQVSKRLFVIRNESDQNPITLIISDSPPSNSGEVIEYMSQNESQAFFKVQTRSRITPELIDETLQVTCQRQQNSYVFKRAEYQRIIEQINKTNESESSDNLHNNDSSSSEEEQSNSEDQSEQSHEEKNQKVDSFQQDSENEDGREKNRKGRGRPKGSKNKKTLMKEQQLLKDGDRQKFIEFKDAIKPKRGKGRPKGSRNKPKNKLQYKQQNQGNGLFGGKRGKGRPKGSKNKIKVSDPTPIAQQNPKRGRGRPPGAKNKPTSSPDISVVKEQSDEQPKQEYERIDRERLEQIFCCTKCEQRQLKRKIFSGQVSFEDSIDKMFDVCEDFGLENKKNIMLELIREGDVTKLKMLLEIKNKAGEYFKPPWSAEKAIQRTKFETKTRKQYLSKTGKEGIYALLHDSNFKKEVWWRKIGIQRIIENIPNLSPEGIYNTLIEQSQQLKNELYRHLPNILRCGKQNLASLILHDMLLNPSENKYNYSQEHFDMLEGKTETLNDQIKFNLIKHNDGANFCSPIHCAAITASPQFLEKLLDIFTDVLGVTDSIGRKPVHYASASMTEGNLIALAERGAELRDIDRKKFTSLMIASYHGLDRNVEYILEKVRDPNFINFRSSEGYTALHYAILNDHIECVRAILNDSSFIEGNEEWKGVVNDMFSLVAGTGNQEIFELLKMKFKGSFSALDRCDGFKRTPTMLAIRNHNNEILYSLLDEGCKHTKCDSTQNSLLHYAAAYGNIEAILLLQKHIEQKPNKRSYYPWEFAIMKGHLGCAQLLESDDFQFSKHDPLYLLLTNMRGTNHYIKCVKYVEERYTKKINYQEQSTMNGYLHLVCMVSEDEYIKIRKMETNLEEEDLREEFSFLQNQLIDFFQDKKLDGYLENKKKQTPLKMCIENINLIGFQKLLTDKINFDVEAGDGSTILHRLSNLACKGIEQMTFVEKKLKESSITELRVNLKKIDQNGFDFLLYFVKNFTETIKETFMKSKKKLMVSGFSEQKAERQAFDDFCKFEEKFKKFMSYIIDLGCDMNGQVMDKRTNCQETFKKWGVQHFLMRFPSLNLIKMFKAKIRDFNAQNNEGMTPLHLFCKNVLSGNLLDTKSLKLPKQYDAEVIIQYLLSNGLNPNTKDSNKSYPILYAAQNHQFNFIMILLKHKSQINQVNLNNEVPFIEIIKNHKNYTIKQIQQILEYAKPNFEDKSKRNALHHLVACSSGFDESIEVCRLLLKKNVKINALDQYERSPIFYCFDPDDQILGEPDDKAELFKFMVQLSDINLNLLDMFKRSVVHYACRKNYFFSVLYLLDMNVNFQIRDHEDNTPLGLCLKHGNLDQAALIIRKGVRYGHVNDEGQKISYFQYSIKFLSAGICFMLLEHGYPIQRALEEVPNEAFKQILKKKYIH